MVMLSTENQYMCPVCMGNVVISSHVSEGDDGKLKVVILETCQVCEHCSTEELFGALALAHIEKSLNELRGWAKAWEDRYRGLLNSLSKRQRRKAEKGDK